jgi:DNA polymerase (family 10)
VTRNEELIEIFNEIADLLDLLGEDRFKPDAYRRAARSLEALGEDVRKVADRGELEEVPGVGEAIAEKIREHLASGRIDYFERLRARVPPGLLKIMQIPGVGPKTTRRFWVELKVEGPAELAEAIQKGRLAGLPGFGPRKIELLTAGLKALGALPGTGERRSPVLVATELADRVAAELRARAPVEALEVAGSLRRARETIGDIDLLATSSRPEEVFEAFSGLPGVQEVRLRGETKETVLFDPGIQIDLRVVAPESYGAALQYFTGSKDHNIRLRTIARDRGLKINEYGVFRGEARIAGRTEEEVYSALELPWMPPEIRENRGEIEVALAGRVPRLVELSDLAGDLHLHVEEPAREPWKDWSAAAKALGLAQLGVVLAGDPAEVARSARSLRRRWSEEVGRAGPELRVGWERAGAASGPLPAGVDYGLLAAGPDEPPPAAAEQGGPRALFVAHLPPSGNEKRARWIAWARAEGLGLEVNPRPLEDGLDGGDIQRALAAQQSVYVSASARRPDELARLKLSVRIARRGWAEPTGIGNHRPLPAAHDGASARPRTARPVARRRSTR